jgi:hypothetical protein
MIARNKYLSPIFREKYKVEGSLRINAEENISANRQKVNRRGEKYYV